MTRFCQVGRCRRHGAVPVHACGIVYACLPCKALIERLTVLNTGSDSGSGEAA